MGFKGSSSGKGGSHRLGHQQVTGKTSRSSAGKGKGLFSKPTGRHTRGSGGSDPRGGAAAGNDRWG